MTTYRLEQTTRTLEMQGAELASFWRRAAAFVLDLLVMVFLFMAVFGPLMLLLLRLGWVRSSAGLSFKLGLTGHGVSWVNWYSLAWAVAYFWLGTYFGRGRTLGKAMLGIRVVSLAHERLSLWHSLERALGYGASMLEFGFGFLQYFIHPNKRTVHDRIAETIVVREPRKRKGKKYPRE